MGCVSAAKFVCDRVPGFVPLRLSRWNETGLYWEHVVASNGSVIFDLTPHCDMPSED